MRIQVALEQAPHHCPLALDAPAMEDRARNGDETSELRHAASSALAHPPPCAMRAPTVRDSARSSASAVCVSAEVLDLQRRR